MLWSKKPGRGAKAIIVAFHEVSKESYASGGELMIDKEVDSSRWRRSAVAETRAGVPRQRHMLIPAARTNALPRGRRPWADPCVAILQKMRSGAVRFERGIVLVLLVDEEPAGFGLVPVHLDTSSTARFLAGFLGQLLKNCGNFGFVPNFRHPGNRQHHHRSLLRRGGSAGEAILGFLRGCLQLRHELVHENGVVAVRAGGNHANLRVRFPSPRNAR